MTKREDLYVNDEPPKALPLRPIIRGPYDENSDDDEHAPDTTTVYAEQHTEVKLNCEVDLDIAATVWMHNGQVWWFWGKHKHLYTEMINRIELITLNLMNEMKSDEKWTE